MLLELGVVADHQVEDSHAAAAGLAAHAPRIKPRAYDRVGAENLLRGGLHRQVDVVRMGASPPRAANRSEEHTSKLQSPCNLVFRLLLEKKKKNTTQPHRSAPHNPAVRDTRTRHRP